ncbi:MAG: FkbM family methyltransferase [Luteolibacter sp.]
MRFVKHVYYSLRGIPSLGVLGAVKLFLARYMDRQFHIRPKGYPAAITIRGRTSDAGILCNIIVCAEYEITGLDQIRSIIDAGANIGLAAIYFSKRFPNAKITSIEPERSNFELLVKNTSHLPNVTAIRAALWPTRAQLSVVDSQSEKWGFQFVADTSGEFDVEGITIHDLLGDGVDLLKIDIEGGEKEVFMGDPDWMNRVQYMLLEIHPGCWKTVFTAFESIEYECRISGENLFFDLRENTNS